VSDAVVCYKVLTERQLKSLTGFPLDGCDCPTCSALRAKGEPDMPFAILDDTPCVTPPPYRRYPVC
jgi:hypothetical protein